MGQSVSQGHLVGGWGLMSVGGSLGEGQWVALEEHVHGQVCKIIFLSFPFRALEASLRENNINISKPMLALFQDPKNPHKRKRIGNTPVGLKNIGNTCWFSAVIQVSTLKWWTVFASSKFEGVRSSDTIANYPCQFMSSNIHSSQLYLSIVEEIGARQSLVK